MKKILSIVLTLGMALSLHAQENDTALLRSNGVMKLEKYIYIHAFERKSDTCLFFSQEFDERMRSYKERQDMSCYGFPNVSETDKIFSSDTSWFQLTFSDGLPVGQMKVRTDQHGKPLYIKLWKLEENDSAETWISYFGDRGAMADSSSSLTVQGVDSLYEYTLVRFNEQDLPVEVKRVGTDGELVSEDSYEHDKNGVLKSVSNTRHGDQPYFMVTFYEHDQDGKVVVSYNSVNQRQEYIYNDKGLVSNIFNYNPKGELESEIIFKYIYR